MKNGKHIWLIARALYEIVRYDALILLGGSGCVLRRVRRQSVMPRSSNGELERNICDAVLVAACFYCKPVLCLQRAASTVILLRKYGVNARLMIGYRPLPFFSHAWVEVNGRVVYGSQAFQRQLRPLFVA